MMCIYRKKIKYYFKLKLLKSINSCIHFLIHTNYKLGFVQNLPDIKPQLFASQFLALIWNATLLWCFLMRQWALSIMLESCTEWWTLTIPPFLLSVFLD